MTAPREGLTRVALDLCEHCLDGCTRHPNASGHGCKTAGCALQGAGARIPYEGLREHVKVPACSRCLDYDTLVELEEYLDDRADVNDGAYGQPVPNKAMRLLQAVRDALAALEGEPAAQEEQ